MLKIEDVEVDDLKNLIKLIEKIEAKFNDESYLGWVQVRNMEKADLLGSGVFARFLQTSESLISQASALKKVINDMVER